MDVYALHLAMAALVGASFVAVSAYYMHRKTLNQLLEFAKTVEKEREDGGAGYDDDSPQHYRKYNGDRQLQRRKGGGGRKKGPNGYYRRSSNSMPDVTSISGGGAGVDDVDAVPVGLPRLHTLPEGRKMSGFSPE